jgi:hypothetical protein
MLASSRLYASRQKNKKKEKQKKAAEKRRTRAPVSAWNRQGGSPCQSLVWTL